MRCIGRLAGAAPRSYFASARGYVLPRRTVSFDSSMGCVMSAGFSGAVCARLQPGDTAANSSAKAPRKRNLSKQRKTLLVSLAGAESLIVSPILNWEKRGLYL